MQEAICKVCCAHLQELQTLENLTPTSDTDEVGIDITAADEQVPLLGVRSCDPHSTPNTSQSSHQLQPLSTVGQPQHRHSALQHQLSSLFRQQELQQHQQQQQPQQQQPRKSHGADAQRVDSALHHSHPALQQDVSQQGLSDEQDSSEVHPQAVATAHDMSCLRPDGKVLFQHVSFQVHPGQMIL